MSRTAQPSSLHPAEYHVNLPTLHPKQLEVLSSPARFKVVCCGRQWGKSTLAAVKIVSAAIGGGDYWWVAPSFPLGDLGWRIIEYLAAQVPGTRFEGRPIYRVTFPGGGTIQVHSADNPDSLRGATLNGVIFDEAAQAKPEAWPILRPTLSARRGWAMFISTPRGLNWFEKLYDEAENRKGWQRWRTPSSESPFLDPEDIEAARVEMDALEFSQEYGAEFVSGSSGQFHADWLRHYTLRGDIYDLGGRLVSAESCSFMHTVDIAWTVGPQADYTVISTWASSPDSDLILVDCNRGHYEGPDIVPKLRRAYERWGGYMIAEPSPIVQEAQRDGLPIRVVKPTKDKVSRALPATVRMESGRVWFPPSSTPWLYELEMELLAFPAGRHDDFVDTLAYACWANHGRSVYETRGVVSI